MLVKKIAIIGPESSGKTTLCEQLSRHFKEPWVPEYARTFLTQLNRPYSEQDLLHIAHEQMKLENQLFQTAHRFLFCDTDLSNIQLWSEEKYSQCTIPLLQLVARQSYHAAVLLTPSQEWLFDPLRETPEYATRDRLFRAYLDMALAYTNQVLVYNRLDWNQVVTFVEQL